MKKIYAVCTLVLLVLNQMVVAVDPTLISGAEQSTVPLLHMEDQIMDDSSLAGEEKEENIKKTEDIEEIEDTEESATLSGRELAETIEKITLEPMMEATSGNIIINIPDYDPVVGRGVGTTMAKDAIIRANFGTTTGTDKRIRISLAEGFRFVKYPVLNVEYTDREVVADSEMTIILESITSKPQKQTYYPSYNSGYLEYKVTPTTTQIEVKNLYVTVDENVYYGSTDILQDAIKVETYIDGNLTDEMSMDIQQNALGVTMTFGITQNSNINSLLSGEQSPAHTVGFGRNVGAVYGFPIYLKSATLSYSYPKELTFVSATSSLIEANYTLDSASGMITFSWNDSYAYSFQGYATLLASGVLPGVYTAATGNMIEVEFYDGTKKTYVNATKRTATVIDPTSLGNKASLQRYNRLYNPELGENFWIQGPGFEIYNPDPLPKTDQVMTFTVGTGYEVRQISFPFATDTKPASIERATRSGLTGTATSDQIIKTINGYGYGISTTSLGLASGEYLSYAQAFLGIVLENQPSHRSHWQYYIHSPMHLMGRLASGANVATVNVQTRADDGSGGIQSGSQNSITGTVTNSTTPSTAYHFLPKTTATIVTAGQRQTWTMTLREPSNEYLYAELIAFTDPTIYIRKPAGVQIYSGNIIVKEIGSGAIPFTVDEYITTQGANIVAIHIPKQIGLYFDGVAKPGVEVSFDFRPDIETMGQINWHDYILADTPQYHSYGPYSATLPQIADTRDANNNGNTGENMMRLNTATTQIVAANVLLMDTYLIPEGGSRQAPYDPSQPQTAVAFAPGAVGKYEVVFDNQRSNTVGSLVYLPIPKVGNNFGPNFQSTGFSRNMSLGKRPSITVYDQYGKNVTAERAGNYEIRYATNATNATDYESATYTTNYSGATMIRMKNDLQMLAGEKVVLSFEYVVDEANDSTRAGLINDFMPYYYFEAGNIGRTNGSRVGAMLQVGSIGGMLFLDENADGVYNTGETQQANKTINLYKGASLQATVQTDGSGQYLFTGLSNGVYKVDFNETLGSYEYFTLKGAGSDKSLNSQVEYQGADEGYVLNVDPVQPSSATINAGILKYDPDTDLTLGLQGTTLILTTTGTNPTTGLQATITPSFFSKIQAPTNPMSRITNNATVATVSSTGLVEGKQAGTATITLTIKDLRGNTQTTQTVITVENKIPISCDIDYNPSTHTNTNVVATLTNCNKPVTITNTSFTPCQGGASEVNNKMCVFTGNSDFTFHFQDSYGNTGNITATVTRIDKSPIVPTITYSTTGWTNQEVTATISFNKTGVTITNTTGVVIASGGEAIHTFTDNTSFTFTYNDDYGNQGSETATVTRIDKIAPTCTITYNPPTNTNGNVVASLTNCSENIIVTNNPNQNYTFTGNGDFTFHFRDGAGNTGSALATVSRIDASQIQSTMTYIPDVPTSGNVQSIISFNKTGVTITSTSGTTTTTLANDTYLFTDNGTFTYTYQDSFGNTGSSAAVITWIDTIAPTCSITYFPSTNTNQDVVATLTNCSETITGTALSYTFTGNGSYTFTFTDLVGNPGSTIATVNRINKTAIVPTVTYSTTGATSGNVLATISFNKTGITITNTTGVVIASGGEAIHMFTDNTSFTFTYHDDYGNQGNETAIVTRIDKTAPTCSVTYNPSTDTNQDVVANLTNCSETITGTALSYTFTGNENYTFTFTDLVGNTGSTIATVDRINKTAIVPTITYNTTGWTNQEVTATISFNKSGITLTNAGGATHLFTDNGTFTFHFHDDYGNTGSAVATVSRIDKTDPTLTLSYNPSTATNQPVLATLTTDEVVTKPTGWSGATTGTQFTKIYTQNTTEPITVYDRVGNQGQTWLLVDWIDTISPVAITVDYSPNTITSGDVEVTITLNETGIVPGRIANPPYEEGQGGSNTGAIQWQKTYDRNTTELVTFNDLAGNQGSIGINISWIDKDIPTCNVQYSTTNLTSQEVIATLTGCSRPITVTSSGGDSHLFIENGSRIFTFQDTIGNTGNTTATVTWIDKTPPSSPSLGGGGGAVLRPDTCPNGDFSPSYYDGECSSLGGLVSSGRTASETNDDSVSSGRTAIQNNEHNSANEVVPPEKSGLPGEGEVPDRAEGFASESRGVYERAKKEHLTSADTYEDFRPNDHITRAEMAKIIMLYSNKVIARTESKAIQTSSGLPSRSVRQVVPTGREGFAQTKPTGQGQNGEKCSSFADLNQVNAELQNYIIQACEFGLMGYYSDGETVKESFSPNEPINRAEVATTISRMLRGNANKGSEERWYQNHLLALRKEDIIQKDIDPMTLETRMNVFLMLSRI